MCEAMLKWHLTQTGELKNGQKLSECSAFISQKRLFSMLRDRYNFPKEGLLSARCITLPHCKTRVKIVQNSVQDTIVSLLTDPRITDIDYLFHDNNPLAPPPEKINYIKDLNTGLSHTETYKRLIKHPGKQVLLPVIFYIDAANTGHFSDLPITAVKISLGIFTRKARDRDMFWRIIGFIPEYSKHASRGKRIAHDSMHMEGIFALNDSNNNEGVRKTESVSKAQDLHSCLAKILEDYVKLQNTGFVWDLCYNGRVYKDIEFVLHTPFMKLDTDEAEKICGKYTTAE